MDCYRCIISIWILRYKFNQYWWHSHGILYVVILQLKLNDIPILNCYYLLIKKTIHILCKCQKEILFINCFTFPPPTPQQNLDMPCRAAALTVQVLRVVGLLHQVSLTGHWESSLRQAWERTWRLNHHVFHSIALECCDPPGLLRLSMPFGHCLTLFGSSFRA